MYNINIIFPYMGVVIINLEEKFYDELKEFRPAPFLFIGSGFSRRYLGLENWKELLEKFCLKEMKPFEYYLSKSQSHLPYTATLMAKDFHEIWWESSRFEESRCRYKKDGEMDNISSPLKYEISRYLKAKTVETNKKAKIIREINTFKDIVVDGIITTNWDGLLESLFPNYKVYIGQDDLLSSVVQEIGEIYKIHGSISDFNSLVLTKEDYLEFNNKNQYLAAKLLTIFIEHPVIFIGYSISDENIKKILLSISKCLSNSNLKKIKNNLFFVEPIFDSSNNQYKKSFINIDDHNLPITLIRVKDYTKIYKPLTKYERKFSVKHLRQLKSQLYKIVKNNDPNGRIATIGIDETTNYNDVDFVIGVGVKEEFSKYGYIGLTYDDVLLDIVLDNKNYDSQFMVEEALQFVLKRAYYTPYYKYLREGGYLDKEGKLKKGKKVPKRVKKYMDKNGEKFITRNTKRLLKSSETLISYDYSLDPDLLMAHILNNGKESVNLKKLHNFLYDQVDILISPEKYKGSEVSNYRKIVRIYDWLKYC